MIIVLSQPNPSLTHSLAHANLLFKFNAFEPDVLFIQQLQMPAEAKLTQGPFVLVEGKGPAAIEAFHLDWSMFKSNLGSLSGRAFRKISPIKADRIFTFIGKWTDQQVHALDAFRIRFL
jgi:hypothetical protein